MPLSRLNRLPSLDRLFNSEAVTVVGLLLVAATAGLLLLQRSHWLVEGDEAMVGLLAKHILEGQRPIFLPGQSYMGALQAYEAALLYELFGMSRLSLKLIPLAASLGFVVSTYWLARHLFSPSAARAAALVAAVPPAYVVSVTLKAWAPYTEVMALGNAMLALALVLAWQGTTRLREALLLGLLAGLCFWLNPVAVYYLATVGLVLLSKLGLRLVPLAPALVGGGVVGAAPLWLANLGNDFATFRYFWEGTSGEYQMAALVEHTLHSGLPRVMGLWHPWGETPLALSWVLGGLLVAGLLALVVRGRRSHGWRLAPTDVPLVFALMVLLAFVFSGFGGSALNPWRVDAAGRYLVPLWGIVPLAVAALAEAAWRWRRALAPLVMVLVLGSHLYGYAASDSLKVFQSPYWSKLPASNTELLAYLHSNDIHHVWANHWVGFPLMFDARETIVAADYHDVYVGGGINRFPQHFTVLERAERPAYLLVTDEPESALERRLREMGVTFTRARIDPYVVIQPLSRTVHPFEVAEALGYDY